MKACPARLVVALALLVLSLPPPLARAQTPAPAQETQASPLARARQMYASARFTEGADLLADAIRTGQVTGDDLNAALELRARCLVKAGRPLEAKEAFKAVLRSNSQYRPDPVQVPPDEINVFTTALKEFQAEQVEAGRRVPASLGLFYGLGQAVNQDIVDLASSAGVQEADNLKSSPEFGYSVRFPIRPRYSVDFQVLRMRATTSDKLDPAILDHAHYIASGTSIVVSYVWSAMTWRTLRLNALAGVGFMRGEATVEFLHNHFGRIIPVQIVGSSTGPYVRGGVEGEWLLAPRFAITGHVVARYANSGKLDWKRPDFEVYEGYPSSKLGGRSVDFSGIAAHVGVRAYIGY